MPGMRLLQRGADGFPQGSDALLQEAYGQIPAAIEFQHHVSMGYERPLEIHGWCWSETFRCWGAIVTFADGWRGLTWPRPAIREGADN